MNIIDIATVCFGAKVYHLQESQYDSLKPTANNKLLFTRFQPAVSSVIEVCFA